VLLLLCCDEELKRGRKIEGYIYGRKERSDGVVKFERRVDWECWGHEEEE